MAKPNGVANFLVRRSAVNGSAIGSRIPAARQPDIDEEERSELYGAVPPRQCLRELTVDELAALVPRIQELRAEKKTWPQVALELGIKTAQAENALARWRREQRKKEQG